MVGQYLGGSIAVGCTFLETVVLLHGLIVQILAIYHKQHLVNIFFLTSKLCCLERCQGLAASCSMPNVASSIYRSILFGVMRYFYLVEQLLCSGYLIGAHYHKYLLLREYTVFRKDIQKRVPTEECGGEVCQVAEHLVPGICPVARELIRIARLLPWLLACLGLLFYVVCTSGIAIIFGFRTIGDYEYLYILKQCAASPK